LDQAKHQAVNKNGKQNLLDIAFHEISPFAPNRRLTLEWIISENISFVNIFVNKMKLICNLFEIITVE